MAPVYKGERGNPVLLDISLKDDMMKIQGDVGAREILEEREDEVRSVKVDTPSVVMDVNTREDLEEIKEFEEKLG